MVSRNKKLLMAITVIIVLAIAGFILYSANSDEPSVEEETKQVSQSEIDAVRAKKGILHGVKGDVADELSVYWFDERTTESTADGQYVCRLHNSASLEIYAEVLIDGDQDVSSPTINYYDNELINESRATDLLFNQCNTSTDQG